MNLSNGYVIGFNLTFLACDRHTDEIRNLQAKLNNILNGTDMKHKRNNSGDIDVQQKRLKPNDNDHAKINCELKV